MMLRRTSTSSGLTVRFNRAAVLAAVLAAAGSAAGCQAGARPAGPPAPGAGLPVREIGAIAGRALLDEEVFLLTEARRLLRVRPVAGEIEGVEVQGLQPAERPWGLAGLQDGSLWTLLSGSTLGEVGRDGRILRRRALEAPHIVLYGWRDRLLGMNLRAGPGDPVLVRAGPDDAVGGPFGDLRARTFARPRAEEWLLNAPLCGITDGEAFPCWFRDETAVSLSFPDGYDRMVFLEGVAGFPTNAFQTTLQELPRVIWDVAIDRQGGIWVLSQLWTDGPAAGPRQLSRHDQAGAVTGLVLLDRPARLILLARDDVAYVLVEARIAKVSLP